MFDRDLAFIRLKCCLNLLTSLLVLVVLSTFPAKYANALTVTFDDITDLSQLAPLGVTFDSNFVIWGPLAGSVLDNPFNGPVTPPNGICVGPCGTESGVIHFALPQTLVSIYALSGPGLDPINPGTMIEALDGASAVVDSAIASTVVQFDLLTVSGSDIRGLRLTSTVFLHEAWDNLSLDNPVIPASEPAALALFAVGLAGLGFLRRRKAA